MGLALFKERRMSQRLQLTGLLPGRLRQVGSKQDVSCKLVDVSEHGLGFILKEEIAPGTRFELILSDKTMLLKVQWGKPDFGKSDCFRYGLVAEDRELDLIQIFTDAGCLK